MDLRTSARELELELGIASNEDAVSIPYTRIVVRAHRVLEQAAQGKSIADIEQLHPAMSVERVVRGGVIVERDPGFVLAAGDIVGVYALREAVGALPEWVGPEVDHPESLSFPTREVDIVLTSPELAGKTLHEIKTRLVQSERPGCFLKGISRQGLDLPLLPNTVLRRGDVISLIGRASSVEALAAQLGRIRESHYKTDIAVHALGMVLGSLLGLMSTHIGMVPVELGVVGLLAGPAAVSAMQEHGLSLVLAGVVVTLLPPIVALYFGRYVLRLHPMILLGALAGAQTEAASMNKIIEQSGSSTPVIGFTVCYAISNVLLAVCGPIIVFMAA